MVLKQLGENEKQYKSTFVHSLKFLVTLALVVFLSVGGVAVFDGTENQPCLDPRDPLALAGAHAPLGGQPSRLANLSRDKKMCPFY